MEAARERLLLAAEGTWPYRRDLHDHEAASRVDVPDLDHAGTLALERLVTAWAPMRALHVEDIVKAVHAATEAHPPGDTTWIGELTPPALDTDRLRVGVEAAIDAGYDLAVDEARRQNPALADHVRRVQRADLQRRIAAYCDGAERLLVAGLVQSASTEAFRLTATTDDIDIAGHVETILGTAPMLAERDILQGMATGGVNEGRYEVMEAILGERTSALEAAAGVASVYALEILDGNTCDECEQIDGQEYQSLAEARVDYPGIGGGYVRCKGRTRCRGSLVIVYATEAPPEGQGPLPVPPPEPAPEPAAPAGEPAEVHVVEATAAVPAEMLVRMFASRTLRRLGARVVARSERFGTFDTRIKMRITNDAGTEQIGIGVRTIRAEQHVAEHDGLILDDRLQGKGVGKDLLASAVREYEQLGIERVEVRAGDRAGRYTWARFGFDFESQRSVDEYRLRMIGVLASKIVAAGVPIDTSGGALLGVARALPETFKLLHVAEHPWDFAGLDIDEAGVRVTGKELMLAGPEWNGVLTLDKASESRKIFDAYTAGR